MGPFRNRTDAGKILAKRIQSFSQIVHSRPIVVAIPKGGVPVAAPLSRELYTSLDLVPVRRVSHPEDPEVALGAVTDEDLVMADIPASHRAGLDEQVVERLGSEARERLRAQMAEVRRTFPEVSLTDRHVILVDDGLATGCTMEAALRWLRKKKVARITAAVPVASAEGYARVRPRVDELFCLVNPHEFYSVGSWYEEFEPVTDQDVMSLLAQALRARGRRVPDLTLAPTGASSAPVEAGDGAQIVDLVDGASKAARAEIRALARPVADPGSIEILASKLSSARIVMLGESTHGTAEFYQVRRRLTESLLARHGFRFVAVEGDWPDFQALNGSLQPNAAEGPRRTLRKFTRWPTWLWANEEMLRFFEWLQGRPHQIFGLDIYSLFESLHLVKGYATKLGAEVSEEILHRYACLDPYATDEISYARSLLRAPEGCRAEVVEALQKLLALRLEEIRLSESELFDARQNALIIKNAEGYYRAMVEEGGGAWNVRAHHMLDTLDALLARAGEGAKAVVWAHNAHVGDHRGVSAAAGADGGTVSLGGLARERYGAENVRLVGLGTYGGSVTAGRAWGEAEEVMPLPPAQRGSWESCLHQVARDSGITEFWMSFDRLPAEHALRETRAQRGVGMVYRPSFESGPDAYVPTRLADRYDAFVYVDHSSALPSLHVPPSSHLVPEAWPSGQ